MSSKRRKRAQRAKVVRTGNAEYVEAMQGLRSSNAAQPHRNRSRYNRNDARRQVAREVNER